MHPHLREGAFAAALSNACVSGIGKNARRGKGGSAGCYDPVVVKAGLVAAGSVSGRKRAACQDGRASSRGRREEVEVNTAVASSQALLARPLAGDVRLYNGSCIS